MSTHDTTAAHEKFRFSVQCHTDDAAVLACLRALCQYVERANMPQIGWGGTKTNVWQRSGGVATFRFTDPAYREQFVREAQRLLGGTWKERGRSDQDPATPQRRR